MPSDSHLKPSFSLYRKWSIGFNVGLVILLVLAVVVMINYLSRDYFTRLHLSTRTKYTLYPRTTAFLSSLTNRVRVVLYYDRNDSLYSTVSELLNEYKLTNPKISVLNVDYLRDAGAAQKIKTDYKLAGAADKNLVIFDCEGRSKVLYGSDLAQYTLEQQERMPNEKEPTFVRKLVSFAGERVFTAALIAVTNPKPLKAYFLSTHGEHRFDSSDELRGYAKFSLLVQQNYVKIETVSLLGTNDVPLDCNLLIIAGPTTALLDIELQKLERYLKQGGRLLALFNSEAIDRETGLEKILAQWGVEVGNRVVKDDQHSPTKEMDMVLSAFSTHAVVNPLLGEGLYLVRPRVIAKLNLHTPAGEGPKVEEVAFTGDHAVLLGTPAVEPRRYPVIAAVEKGAIKGVTTERGNTRMLVVGDSFFLANHQLDLLGNRDFANSAINWLLDRPQLFEGVGPRSVTDYRLIMTKTQLQSAQWLLLAGMPGAVLLVGVLVWFWRRS
jgi:hypothetical protein